MPRANWSFSMWVNTYQFSRVTSPPVPWLAALNVRRSHYLTASRKLVILFVVHAKKSKKLPESEGTLWFTVNQRIFSGPKQTPIDSSVYRLAQDSVQDRSRTPTVIDYRQQPWIDFPYRGSWARRIPSPSGSITCRTCCLWNNRRMGQINWRAKSNIRGVWLQYHRD